MTLEAVGGGAQASGRLVAGLAVGQQASWVVLNATHPLLEGLPSPDAMLSAHVFASNRQSAIADVWVAGQRQVHGGHHHLHAQAQQAFVQARRVLAQTSKH
jgi:formimidoylglutamate deiminase